MKTQLVKAEHEGKKFVLFNSRGTVLELSKKEFDLFRKHQNQKTFPNRHRKFFNALSYYGFLKFENHNPEKTFIKYSRKLLHHSSPKPAFSSPIVAHLGITNSCNMHCKYCSVRKPYRSMKELSTGQLKAIIRKLCKLGIFQIGLTGGEPTMRKDLVELAGYITSKNSTFNLTTNGWNLTEELVTSLKKAGMRQCQVSLDSHIPEINDELRSRGSFERTVGAISLLKKHGIIVGIDCVVSNNNLKHIPEFVEWLGRENVPYITLIKIKQGDLPLQAFKKLLPDYNSYSGLIEEMCNRENANPLVTIDCGSVSNLHFTVRDNELDKIPVAGCPAGHTLLSISPNGDIHPCVALSAPEFRIGNALTDNLEDLWNTNKALGELRKVKEKVEGKCKSCGRLDYCRAGCRGIVNSLCGRLWESDKTCERRC